MSELLGQHAARRESSSTPFQVITAFFAFLLLCFFFPPHLSHWSLSGWEPNADHPTGGVMLSKQMSRVETTLPPLKQLCVFKTI